MFDSLTDRFEGIITRLRSRGKLTEKDIDEVAREIRLALLEADVNVRVVKSFVARLKERAIGAEVSTSDAGDNGEYRTPAAVASHELAREPFSEADIA